VPTGKRARKVPAKTRIIFRPGVLESAPCRTHAEPMRQVSDAFLLNMAEIAATLIGLFLVGVFFYMETGLRRWGRERQVVGPYLRAGTRSTLIFFALPLGLSLALVALEPLWARLIFVPMSLLLLVANVDTLIHIRGLVRVTGSTALLVNEVVTSAMAPAIVVTPWALGGLQPTREDLTWAILLAFLAGFLIIAAIVMSAFLDRSRSDADGDQRDKWGT
jgi:hypothetical protein